jgi:peptidoglycan/xylan/chitin deacetylase (PgdA/CDA1 family)/2-polyprenyl-3-methyl-5-hydroxy-6-metoxy-1,4-benzoquinol methylase
MICPLSPAHFVALGAFQLFVLLIFIDLKLAPLPLLIFIVICLVAPLFPGFSFFLPITSRGKSGKNTVSLTFDDGPDPEITPLVLDLLARHALKATFFVTGIGAERNPGIIRAILAGGHTIGNHSYSHSPFLMLKGGGTLRREIASAQAVLQEFGIVPLAFRPPVGVTSARLWRILLELGMFCVNFSCRAADMGNRRINGLSRRILAKAAPGDIILLHDVAPKGGTTDQLLGEFEAICTGLKLKGLEIVPLERLIGREVMQRGDLEGGTVPAEMFYNALAESYDQEQFASKVSLSRNTEYRLFSAQLPLLFSGADRVLEIGAGTGIFTLDIARNCREVLAVDISGKMLEILMNKAKAAGLENIRALKGDVETMELDGQFSVACAFSSLEYLNDLPSFIKRLAEHLEPEGAVYFVTARTSLFRLFTQIGNAMRQGIWLKAHSKKELEAMLVAAGFEQIHIMSHLFKSLLSGGMLLEVIARKASPRPSAGAVEL